MNNGDGDDDDDNNNDNNNNNRVSESVESVNSMKGLFFLCYHSHLFFGH